MPSFKETYEAIKADYSAGEKNFNVACEMLPDGMQVKCTMGAKPFGARLSVAPRIIIRNMKVMTISVTRQATSE